MQSHMHPASPRSATPPTEVLAQVPAQVSPGASIEGVPAAQWFKEAAQRQKRSNQFATFEEPKRTPTPSRASANGGAGSISHSAGGGTDALRTQQAHRSLDDFQSPPPAWAPSVSGSKTIEPFRSMPSTMGAAKEPRSANIKVSTATPAQAPEPSVSPPNEPEKPQYYQERTLRYLRHIAPFVKEYSKKAGTDPRALMLALADEHRDVYTQGAGREVAQRGQDISAYIHPGVLSLINEKVLGRSPDIGPSNINVTTAQEILGELGYSNGIAATSRYIQTNQGTAEVGAFYMKDIQDELDHLLSKVTDPDERAAHLSQFWRQGLHERLNKIRENRPAGLGIHGVKNFKERLAELDAVLR
jgi:hypothetical protein